MSHAIRQTKEYAHNNAQQAAGTIRMPFLMHKEPTKHTVRKTEKGSLNGKNTVIHMSIAGNAYLQTTNYQQFAKILFLTEPSPRDAKIQFSQKTRHCPSENKYATTHCLAREFTMSPP
ncbi:MAG: hypothetical protein NC113_06795 [Bacteroides sp.]|nr:hypothetical protein [Bacteroides sp.]MCM1447913.1 hypothetical protein [Bacteroides sp.]